MRTKEINYMFDLSDEFEAHMLNYILKDPLLHGFKKNEKRIIKFYLTKIDFNIYDLENKKDRLLIIDKIATYFGYEERKVLSAITRYTDMIGEITGKITGPAIEEWNKIQLEKEPSLARENS